MKSVVIKLDKNRCYELTEKLFLEMSGIDKTGKKFDRMKEDALKIRNLIEDRIDINVKCNYYGHIEFDDRSVKIENEVFSCNAFEQIDKTTVNGAYIYALTAGEYDFEEESIMNRLYADIWGTSFTDAARILLDEELSKKDRLSDSFGPGFYGMSLDEMKKIDSLLNLEEIGIELRKGKILVPVKSCVGIFFSVDERYQKLDSACMDCIGSERSCKLCNQREIN